jgi:HisA/HisF family protein
MQILPVIDLLHGGVVRGVGGRRDEYRPLVSSIVAGSEPFTVAAALRNVCGHPRLYVADLDAILHRTPHVQLYEQLIAAGGQPLVDAGVQSADEAKTVAATGADVIAGLETVPDAATLADIVAAVGPERTVFSLDLKHGRSLGGPAWPDDPLAIVHAAVTAGITRLIVLDLADVGSSTGGSTQQLCRQLHDRWPSLALISGGGVRNAADLSRWSDSGVSAVLVASALHDGTLDFSL